MNLLQEGRRVLRAEARAILSASRLLDQSFQEALALLKEVRGKLVVTGIGKSGLLGRRIASIFSSTGTPAFFMHPTEGLHGDIGILSGGDVVILISHSGKSDELLSLIPYIKRRGAKTIAITRDRHSALSRVCDVTVVTGVHREAACPFNLVPTTSSAVTAAIGDSLAIALLKLKGFKKHDYLNVHPGGAIGKRLLFRVADLMQSGARVPRVSVEAALSDALKEMSEKKLGMTCVVDRRQRLLGILTDGDLRRLLQRGESDLSAGVREAMTPHPKTVLKTLLAVEALSIMERHTITSLVVADRGRRVEGVLHMHSILKAGVV